MEEEKPDTQHLVLKPKVVVPTDKPSHPGDEAAISVQKFHQQNRVAEERLSRRGRRGTRPTPRDPEPPQELPPGFKPKEITPVNAPARPDDEDAISVPEILLENHIAEVESGLAEVGYRKKRKSRRIRDFLLIVGSVDIGVAMVMKSMGNPVTMIYGIAAITLVTSTVGWIMFVVMDDY